ncbi:MAG: metallopeptidase [Eubacterium sp.]|nr:metallopeptidase [Eubacterium sp.]
MFHLSDEVQSRNVLAERALGLSRDEIYIDMPFFGTALANLRFKSNDALVTCATDGEFLYYHDEHILRLFEDNPVYLNRLYLHSLLHLLFAHPWLRGDRDLWLWGIACDIAVEYTIDHLEKQCIKRIIGLTRSTVYDQLLQSGRGISAAVIYRELQTNNDEKNNRLYRDFFSDDHALWPQEKRLSEQQVMLRKKWQQTAENTEEKKKQGRDSGSGDESISYQIRAAKSRRNYRDFLQQFMIRREEMQIDPDEFDIGYYMYGLNLYKNMPLVEPVETREVNRIRDFCVVVDTSYSTSGELIRNFLTETFNLFRERDNFFRNNRLHLIQADDEVHDDILITCESDIENVFSNFEIKGGGNTDFRPAFTYVDELAESGAFEQLCGLLYFTDGLGIYPDREPAYKTAFLFLDEYENLSVPPWAIKIVLDEAEFSNNHEANTL